jgi:hypothetical protein
VGARFSAIEASWIPLLSGSDRVSSMDAPEPDHCAAYGNFA